MLCFNADLQFKILIEHGGKQFLPKYLETKAGELLQVEEQQWTTLKANNTLPPNPPPQKKKTKKLVIPCENQKES